MQRKPLRVTYIYSRKGFALTALPYYAKRLITFISNGSMFAKSMWAKNFTANEIMMKSIVGFHAFAFLKSANDLFLHVLRPNLKVLWLTIVTHPSPRLSNRLF